MLRKNDSYHEAKKPEQALEWAERGVKAFPEHTDSRLRDFLAEEYHSRERHDEAMELVWAQFVESQHNYLSTYQKLKQSADRYGQWPKWRKRALRLLRERLDQARSNTAKLRWQWGRVDYSELVRILLWEGETEAAWREALEGDCSDALWLQLAALREKDHPEEALEIYRRKIEPTINQKNNQAYEQAAGFVRKVRDLMKRLGREAEFAAYLESLRKAHKPKRNFMALLDKMN